MVVLLAAIGSASLAVIAAHATLVARSLAELRAAHHIGALHHAEQTATQLTRTTV
ncbi:hypothetical protein ACL02S_00525 [Nocardia sp. 004]|uniref:hypothetical protein n=1 Tax=Nocardia sp. 004 TaxID=3385978 RepID=UPI00399F5A3A